VYIGIMAYIQNILPGSSIFFFVYLFTGSGSSVFSTHIYWSTSGMPSCSFNYH